MSAATLFEDCEIREVLGWFHAVSQVPRGSGNMDGISRFLLDFAAGHGLEASRDRAKNVIIRKPAAPGYEDIRPVILQAHMDIVCEKDACSAHDFARDPIRVLRDGDRIYADHTTLGADDGIGMAFILALLAAEDIPHPALEALFTADEETDMSGALALDCNALQARSLINLDATAVTCSCSGELEFEIRLPRVAAPAAEGSRCGALAVRGLLGGHTGDNSMEGRGNATFLLARILFDLQKDAELRVVEFTGGGSMSTALCRTAGCTFLYPCGARQAVEQKVKTWRSILAGELAKTDPGVEVVFEDVAQLPAEASDTNSSRQLLSLLLSLPEGLGDVNHVFPGMMESVVNTGIVHTQDDAFALVTLIRSFSATKKRLLGEKVRLACGLHGAEARVSREIPEWRCDAGSALIRLICSTFPERALTASQGTQESGIFCSKLPDLDIVGLGARIYDPHSPGEHILISETAQCWRDLLEVLKAKEW